MAQSDRVTDLIMHYYLEHGRNRDLEKYLRLRRMSNATRSSSDGSLPGLDELQRKMQPGGGCGASNRSGLGKSMENLSTLRKEAEQQELIEGEKALRNASADSAKATNKSAEHSDNKVGSAVQAKGVTVKEKKVEQKSGRNFNFNLESVIEINLPPPPTITMTAPAGATIAPITYALPAALPPQAPPVGRAEPTRTIVHENSTQTAAAEAAAPSEDDPIRPVMKSHVPTPGEETLDSLKDISPVSSIASNKQRLEWDSLGDIGYDSSERLQMCGAADLNETEKRCLQRYFARKGLNFDRSVVVVRQRDEREKKSRPTDGSMLLVNPGAQSTPKPTVMMTRGHEEAKSTQTSLRSRGMESRGVQASVYLHSEREVERPTSRQDVGVGTTDSCTLASVDAAESFEFFTPSVAGTEPNNSPSVGASVPCTPVHSSSVTSTSTSSSSATAANASAGGSGCSTQRPTFDDEVRLGLTLYNSICELQSMPTGVKESLIDKIFRKLSRHDPKKRSREQLLHDYAEAIRKRNRREDARASKQDNVYDDVGSPSSGEKKVKEREAKEEQGGSSEQRDLTVLGAPIQEGEQDIEKTEPKAVAAEERAGSENVSVGSVKGSGVASNEAKNVHRTSHSPDHSSLQRTTGSSLGESVGTTKENRVPRKLRSAPDARSDRRVREAMRDYLQPMTQSEVEYENLRDLRQRLNGSRQRANDPQLAQIDRAIEQLLVRKMLLLNADESAIPSPTAVVEVDPIQSEAGQLPSERGETSVYTSVHEATGGVSVNKSSSNSSPKENSSSSGWNSHYHMAKVIAKNRSKLKTPTSDTSSSVPPASSDVSIPTFIRQKREKFVENYDHVRHQQQLQRRAFEEQNHIYTRPYSSSGQRRHADQRRPQEKENYKLAPVVGKKDKQQLSKGAVTPSLSRSNHSLLSAPQFISSDSISIPVVTTLTNTTTTHHYDIKSRRHSPPTVGRTAGTQTTDSILRTKPIFGEPKAVQVPSSMDMRRPETLVPCSASVQCHCPCGRQQQQQQQMVRENWAAMDEHSATRRRTEIVDGTGVSRQDKQAQTKPSSIAYVITFEGGQERKPATPSRSSSSQRSSSVSRQGSMYESEPENGKDNDSEKLLTLREQFRRSCPATLSKIEQRRQCINELNKLRSKRNQQRQRLLLLTSDDSLRRTSAVGRGQLPPPPLSQRRVFASTRAIRESTRQRVRNLPEVQRKKEIERFNNLKRKNRIIKDVYNKNLQRKVLRGQVDLSNSVRVIQD